MSTPSPLNTPANSTAIYPAPTTAIRFGNCFNANTSFEVIPYSAPSTFGIVGCPPVAISIWSAVYCSPFTSTVFLLTNLAYPLITSTLLLFSPRSYEPCILSIYDERLSTNLEKSNSTSPNVNP